MAAAQIVGDEYDSSVHYDKYTSWQGDHCRVYGLMI